MNKEQRNKFVHHLFAAMLEELDAAKLAPISAACVVEFPDASVTSMDPTVAPEHLERMMVDFLGMTLSALPVDRRRAVFDALRSAVDGP